MTRETALVVEVIARYQSPRKAKGEIAIERYKDKKIVDGQMKAEKKGN